MLSSILIVTPLLVFGWALHFVLFMTIGFWKSCQNEIKIKEAYRSVPVDSAEYFARYLPKS